MSFSSLKELKEKARKENKNVWEVVLEDDMQERMVTRAISIEKMKGMYLAMKQADSSYEKGLESASKLVGGDGAKIEEALKRGTILAGNFIGSVMMKAIKMGESNACMRRIVAAPTAGACGVLPAVLLSYQEQEEVSDEKIIEALYVAAGVGQVIATRAFIAGALGGCQAEIGAASAMATSALVYLKGGSIDEIFHGSAIALKSLLGLVCDPVAGLVEIPCVKRNVIGAVNAITSADMACAGLQSKIPPDEVIDAMRSVGLSMSTDLKETGKGGLAATPTGIEIANALSP